jgi:Outer membrane lipoprotein-sorting protein
MHRFGLSALLCLCIGLSACDSGAAPMNPAPTNAPAANAAPLPDMTAVIKKLTMLDGAQDMTAEMQLQVEDADGKRAQLAFLLQRKYTPEQTSTFIKVTAPREESDKAILAIEKDGQPTEATSYLAGLKKLAKLKSNNQVSFREAKVTVQELLGMELLQYEYGKAERVADNGQSLIKAEGKAKANSNLAYPRIVVYVGEAPHDPVKVELYDEKNELAKRATFDPLKEQQGKRMISRVVFDDLVAKRKSTIETRSFKLDQNLSPKLFTEENLKGTITSASQKLAQ